MREFEVVCDALTASEEQGDIYTHAAPSVIFADMRHQRLPQCRTTRDPTRIIDSEEPEHYSSVVLYVVVGLKGYGLGCRLELSKVSLRNA